jgi:hypothetical protein
MSWIRCTCCIFVAAIVLFAVGAVFHIGVPIIVPHIASQFENNALFRPWKGWTSTYMLIHPLWFGGVFGAGFLALKSRHALAPGWKGGLEYGLGVFMVGSFPVYLLVFASLQVSPEVILAWGSQSCCQYVAAGIAVGAIARSPLVVVRLDSPSRE